MKRTLARIMSLVLCLAFLSACGGKPAGGQETPSGGEGGETQNPANEGPLVVGYSPFNGKFSPFFSETAYDQDVWAITAASLLENDRQGGMILKGGTGDGEVVAYMGTDYTYKALSNCEIVENTDGTVDYNFTLRDDVKFSDGTPMTIDDAIFSFYVLCDPTYDGQSTLYAIPIVGMEEYRSGMETRLNLIVKAGPDGYKATDHYTQEQYDAFWKAFDAAGVKFAQSILDYIVENEYATEEDSVAKQASNWGFTLAEDADAAAFWAAIVEKYGYDLSDSGINAEKATDSITDFISKELGDGWAQYIAGVQTGNSASNIAGLKKTGDYSMTVTLSKVDATAIYKLALTVAPLHYYGDKALYDYENDQFGFPKGDLSAVRAKTSAPMGAGPYKFIKFENGVVNFEANEYYFKGAPKIKYLNFQQCTTDNDKTDGVKTGTIDITDPSFSNSTVEAIKKVNSNGEVTGDKITTNTVDNLGYGYLGISAHLVNVGGEPGSEASKNLRKAFGTVFSVYRNVAVESYYHERASVINCPISNTSWAAPQPTDDGYKVAFSVDAQGNDLYTSSMSAEERYAAALKGALSFFEAAGYTVTDGKVTAAPAGAKLEYEVQIPADGSGDHPSFMMISEASKALETIGIKLIIKDLSNSSALWEDLDALQVEMWCAAWGATIDPDMYQIYYADVANFTTPLGAPQNPYGGPGQGGSSGRYCIADAQLDELILAARESLDQSYRKTMYKACLDIIVDWATEIPVYQRQNAIIFSTERVNMDTVTPDITTFYGWMGDIQNTELK